MVLVAAVRNCMQNLMTPSATTAVLRACIFDVDGVIMNSPHERAWRDALSGVADPARFTTAMYQTHVAGKPRLEGARAALEALSVPGAAEKASAYADRKQRLIEKMIEAGVAPFPDALRLLDALANVGWPMAAASSSKNANGMMRGVRLPSGKGLLEAFRANVCGRAVAHGKPAPDIFLLAATALGFAPSACCVIEDAPAGIEAAVRGNMIGLGVARLDDTDSLRNAGARVVVRSLDELAVDALVGGRLEAHAAS